MGYIVERKWKEKAKETKEKNPYKARFALIKNIRSGNYLNFGLCVEEKRFFPKEMSSWRENLLTRDYSL